MLIPNKMNITIFAYIIVGVIAVSLVSFIAEKVEPYLLIKFVVESSSGATQQEVINDIAKMPEKDVGGKIEMVVAAIVITKLLVNALILYVLSCFITNKLSKSFNSTSSKSGVR